MQNKDYSKLISTFTKLDEKLQQTRATSEELVIFVQNTLGVKYTHALSIVETWAVYNEVL